MKYHISRFARPRVILLTIVVAILTMFAPTGITATAAHALFTTGSGRVSLQGHLVPALKGRLPLHATSGNQILNLAITLRPRDQQGLQRLITAQNDKTSSQYHKYLTSAQFSALFGPSEATVSAVTSYLQSQGLEVRRTAPDHLVIDATGTVAAVEHAFSVQISDYSLNGHIVFAPTTEPSLPGTLATNILGIAGLDNAALYHPLGLSAAHKPDSKEASSGKAGSGPWGGYTPSDLRAAYNMPSLISSSDGTGQTVALVELAGYSSSDVNQYLSSYNLGSPKYTQILLPGASNATGSGSSEADLDMEVLSAVAPGASQLVYIGPDSTQGLTDTYAKIVTDDLATVVSTSWGACEPYFGNAELASLDAIFAQGATQGQAFFAASGDAGAYGCAVGGVNNSTLQVDSPADDPNVVGVGGTTLNTGSGGTYGSEVAWSCATCTGSKNQNPQGSGGGGGLSTYFHMPTYQNGPGVPNQYSNGMREVPDVSANADPATGYSFYCTVTADSACTSTDNPTCGSGTGWCVTGGTSAAAPLWAGVAADINEYLYNRAEPTLGTASATLYQLFNTIQTYPAYNDVSNGYNLYYVASPGYDMATGIGSPNVWNLAQDAAIGVPNERVSRTWYFAEGYTGTGFTEFLTLANPNAVAAHVQVRYLMGGGTVITKTYTLPASSRLTKTINNEIGANQSISMEITSDLPIVAERPMYFTYTGLSGYTIPGGSDVLGATHLDTQFDFSYLDTSAGHDTYLTILNPNAGTMKVTVQYVPTTGGYGTTVSHNINANSRGTIHVNTEGLTPGSYSALVTLSTPGLVERPMYLVDSATGYTGATDIVGVPAPLANWYFAEGYTGTSFSERYILTNPTTNSNTTSVTATVTFDKSDGSSVSATVSLAWGQQKVIDASTVLGTGVNNSAWVHANGPILAERYMSFDYTGPVGTAGSSSIPGATDVLGATSPTTTYYFAEGYTGGSFAEYLTIANPSTTQAATVQVTFLPATGSPPTLMTYLIAAGTRFTLNTSKVMPTQSFSMVVQSSVPVIAERPMYFSYGAATQTGGSDIVGYSPAPQWSVFPAPNQAQAFAAPSTNDVWAVGGFSSEHWDGTTWSNIPAVGPSIFGGGFQGVAAVSTNDVWAVGQYFCCQDNAKTDTVIEHWDGTAWSQVLSPNPDSYGNYLTGVAAVATNDVWAVGTYGGNNAPAHTLTLHWDGASWSIVPSPDDGTSFSVLNSVVAVSAHDVWAVGKYLNASSVYQTLVEHWDGSSWSIIPSPSLGTNDTLTSVSAVSVSDVWAVGSYAGTNSANQTLVEHWNGTAWNVVVSPNPNAQGDVLYNVFGLSTADVWAVGYTNAGGLIEHWDGAKWGVVPCPTAATYLQGIVATSPDDAWAGGSPMVRFG